MTERYPTDKELLEIRTWHPDDLHGLMDFVGDIWAYGDWGWDQDGDLYTISTAGWSGNEDVIDAMSDNAIWWAMHWRTSRRGGHFTFAPMGYDLRDSGAEGGGHG